MPGAHEDPLSKDRAFLGGERAEVSRALNDLESTKLDAVERTRARFARLGKEGALGRAHAIGVTGPPGVGKSTLVAALVKVLRAEKKTIAVLAVDPSSVRSGGALLGDRIRLALDPQDHGVFVRSLATAGELGGIARSVPLGVQLLSAAFDVVVVETVGIGQSETEVRHVVDTLVFVVQPGSGDSVQFLKAGIMEVPDVFVVNKGDHPAAGATTRELSASLAALRAAGILAEPPPVLSTSASTGQGVSELIVALGAHRSRLVESGELARRRVAGTTAWALSVFRRRHGEIGVERLGGRDAVARRIQSRIAAGAAVLEVLDELDPI